MRFQFTTEPREQADFAGMCEHHQTSPHSIFTKQRLVTRPTPSGRISLMGNRRTEVRGAEQIEQAVSADAELEDCLRQDFGIELE
jgi:N-hydroxyarylamine O-acetyltransferase